MPEFYEEDEYHRQELDRHRENRARLAQAYARYSTSGQGSIEFGKRIDFGLTFIEKPYVSYGAEIDIDELEDLLGKASDDNLTPALPLCTGFVTEWDIDDRDFYTGCWVAASISFPANLYIPANVNPSIVHHFTFAAIAYKDIPLGGTE